MRDLRTALFLCRDTSLGPDGILCRPIILTACMMKLFEEMVNSRLVWFLEKESHLSSIKYGFSRSRSTTHALVHLEARIYRTFAEKHHLVIVFFFFYLEKAYENIWRYCILLVLHY